MDLNSDDLWGNLDIVRLEVVVRELSIGVRGHGSVGLGSWVGVMTCSPDWIIISIMNLLWLRTGMMMCHPE